MCAIVLLVWTTVDLTNVGLCALENEDPLSVPSAAATMNAVDRAPLPDSSQPVPHIDDCFCCSHCVEPGGMTVPAVAEFVSRRELIAGDRLPLPDHISIYHPPLILS